MRAPMPESPRPAGTSPGTSTRPRPTRCPSPPRGPADDAARARRLAVGRAGRGDPAGGVRRRDRRRPAARRGGHRARRRPGAGRDLPARGEPTTTVLGGVFGVAIASGISVWTGSAANFFLVGIVAALIGLVATTVSVVVRRPLTGLAWNALHGGGHAWRAGPTGPARPRRRHAGRRGRVRRALRGDAVALRHRLDRRARDREDRDGYADDPRGRGRGLLGLPPVDPAPDHPADPDRGRSPARGERPAREALPAVGAHAHRGVGPAVPVVVAHPLHEGDEDPPGEDLGADLEVRTGRPLVVQDAELAVGREPLGRQVERARRGRRSSCPGSPSSGAPAARAARAAATTSSTASAMYCGSGMPGAHSPRRSSETVRASRTRRAGSARARLRTRPNGAANSPALPGRSPRTAR